MRLSGHAEVQADQFSMFCMGNAVVFQTGQCTRFGRFAG